MACKRVLYFHQYFSTRSGATGTRSYEFAKRLINEGYQVTMVCCSTQLTKLDAVKTKSQSSKKVYDVDGIRVVEFSLNYSNRDGLIKRSYKFMKFAIKSTVLVFTEKYDLIFATSTPLTVAVPGIVAKLFLRKKFIFEVRDLWPELPRAMGVVKNPFVLKALDILESLAYRCSDRAIALSPGIKKGILSKRSGLPVTMVPNGCDLDVFYPSDKFVDIPGVKADDFVVIFTGAHGLANGLDAVLNAAEIAKKRGHNKIKFVFIGDGKEKPRLVRTVKERQLGNCVFLDPVPKSELNGYLARASVGLMVLKNIEAFYYGTSPNKFFDYIAAGLPVLNNYPGWLSDLIEENSCGVVVTPDSPEAFVESLFMLSENKRILEGQAKKARELAESQFDRKLLVADFLEVIKSV